MFNKEAALIPTIILSSALLLTGCASGSSANSGSPDPASSPTNAEAPKDPGHIPPPEQLADEYKAYYYAPSTVQEEAWAYYQSIGSTTYKDDAAVRSTTTEEWNAARADGTDFTKFDKLYGEVSSDVEQTALNVSAHLEKNPSATVEELNGNKELIINRYENLGSVDVEKDPSTGFYFSVFNMKDTQNGVAYGILVPQEGITPEFDAPAEAQ